METPPTHAGDDLPDDLHLHGVRAATEEVAAFRQRHRDWIERLGATRRTPLYALPAAAIDRLEQPYCGQPPLLGPTDAAAERELMQLCRRHHAIGFEGDRPILCELLLEPPRPPDEAMLRLAGWTAGEQMAVRKAIQARNRPNGQRARLRGYLGWLLTDPAFLRAARTLERMWNDLPEDRRPPMPLSRALRVPLGPDASGFPDDLPRFLDDFRAACDRWSLTGFASWDFPMLQGPHLPCVLPPGSLAMPRHGLHLFLPLYYPLTHDDDLLRQIRKQQVFLAQDAGLPVDVAGLRQYRRYGAMLDVLHLERTVTRRYLTPGRSPGRVAPLIEAIAKHLKLSIDAVKRLRKQISARRAAAPERAPRPGAAWAPEGE